MQHGTAEEPPSRGRTKSASWGYIGRRAGLFVFWSLALYLVVVAFYSIVPQALRSPPRPPPPRADCREALLKLRGSLLEGLSVHVRDGGPGERAWLSRWDRRFASVRPRCRGRGLEEAVILLSRLRRETVRQARRFDRHLAPDLRRLARLLHEPSPSPIPHAQETSP